MTLLKHAYSYSFSCDGVVLGYYMIQFHKINLNICPESIGDYYARIDYCMAMHIGLLAVDSKFQKKRIGTNVLKTLIKMVKNYSKSLPIRLITIDALKEFSEWYIEIGFTYFDEKDLQDEKSTISMYIDCIELVSMEKIKEYQECY